MAPTSNTGAPPPSVRQHRKGGGGRSNAQTRADTPESSKVAQAGGGDERERRDIVTGEVMPEHRLVRFVAGPDGQVVPDVAAKLPGRGLWVEASSAAVDKAVEKKLFSRAAKQQVHATADLARRTENALLQRILGDLGLARRAGGLILGFDSVLRSFDGGATPPRALIEAHDGSHDGKRKLYAAAHRQHLDCVVIDCLSSAELGLALGRENVIHAAIQPGGLADRLIFDAERLKGFRSQNTASNPARTESPRA